jgi:hypothetical protein
VGLVRLAHNRIFELVAPWELAGSQSFAYFRPAAIYEPLKNKSFWAR